MLKSFFIKQPHNLFMLTAGLLFVVAFIFWGQSTDLHLGNTYLVFPAMYFVWGVAILFLAVWSIYSLTVNVLLNNTLIWLHFVATIIALAACIIAALWMEKTTSLYFDSKEYGQRRKLVSTILSPFALLFLFGQMAYPVNLIAGLIKRAKTSKE